MKSWVWLVGATVGLFSAGPALACGGGGITTVSAGVVASAQRIILSARSNGTTDIVAQISVPTTSADYGVLIPVPSEPTLDDQPISSNDLDILDQQSAPRIAVTDNDGASGDIGCGCIAGGNDDDSAAPGAGQPVTVSSTVDIGPVTAVSLTADDAGAVNTWLADNGFVIPDDQLGLLDNYVAAGRYFIAIKRNDSATSASPSSIGIHYTLTGDHRLLSLAFARLGAAPTVSFTVFVAPPSYVGVTPSAPFQSLTLTDLDAGLLRAGKYSAAVQAAVKAHGAQAFVLEDTTALENFSSSLSPSSALNRVFDRGQLITRMSTVLAADDLTADASFFGPGQAFQSERFVMNQRASIKYESAGGLALLSALGLLRRRRRVRS